jgi:hypothetical protein
VEDIYRDVDTNNYIHATPTQVPKDARQISHATDAIIPAGYPNVDVSPSQLALRGALQIAESLHGNGAQQP